MKKALKQFLSFVLIKNVEEVNVIEYKEESDENGEAVSLVKCLEQNGAVSVYQIKTNLLGYVKNNKKGNFKTS